MTANDLPSGEMASEFISDFFLDYKSVGADAGLAGEAEAAGNGAVYGLIDIGIGENYEWGVAAEFHGHAFDGVGAFGH